MKNTTSEELYGYDNYRLFLRDYFTRQKKLRAAFSHRFFARRAGFSSSSFCAHVIEGKRNLTDKSLQKMVRGLGLSGRGAAYFSALVNFNQARTVDEREKHFGILERLRKGTEFYRLHQKQYAYYDEWYYPVIRELAVHAPWHGDYAALARLVQPAITPEKARRAVATLLGIGLLVSNEDGSFHQPGDAVSAADVPSAITRKSRKEFMLRAIEAAEGLPVEQRHIAGVTVSMSMHTYRRTVARLDELRRQILLDALDDPQVDGVFQFNFQAFPLSQPLVDPSASRRTPGEVE